MFEICYVISKRKRIHSHKQSTVSCCQGVLMYPIHEKTVTTNLMILSLIYKITVGSDF